MRWTWGLAAFGVGSAVAASASDPGASGAAAGQVWPAFVLVAGLLLIGLVAADDRLFAFAGERLVTGCRGGRLLFVCVAAMVMVVTAVLNLDTSVAFLTPVVVQSARGRPDGGSALVSACLLLSNAGSLLLPGSNLTNLIVVGHLHLSGTSFASRMGLPWVVAGLVTAGVVALISRGALRQPSVAPNANRPPVVGMGAAAVTAAVVLVLVLHDPAPEVAAVGVAVAAVRMATGRLKPGRAWDVIGVPVLAGLFGLAVALGTLGRVWSGPAEGLSHLGAWGTVAAGGASTVLINNLPAAALLSARPPAHPLALLIGLDVGPNLFFTGSLAWVLWYNAARASGGRPELGSTVRMGLVAGPLAAAAAVAALLVVGTVS